MESNDPLKRKQTILSLIDMLSELSGDNAFEAGVFRCHECRFRVLIDLLDVSSPPMLEEDLRESGSSATGTTCLMRPL